MEEAEKPDYFRDLYELGLDADASLDEKIEEAISVGRDRLGVDYGVLSYTGGGEYEVVGSTIDSGDFSAGSIHELETTWCRHVVDGREPLLIDDAGRSEFSDDVAREVTGLQCYIGAPIVVDGTVYGTLCFSGEEPRAEAFDEADRQFVELLTRWIGYEIEREHHYQVLEAQNERLDEFAGVLAHDLRNPLTGAQGYAEIAAETATEPVSDYLETVLDSLDRMESLVGDMLSLAREGVDVGEREPVRLSTVAREAWTTVQPATATLDIASDRTLMADRSRLSQLFENLFRNVENHCGTDVVVTVEGTADGFAVEDTGPGLPDDVERSVFDDEYGSSRAGLGLLIVERVVSGHGWRGTVESSDSGTRFVFTGVETRTTQPAAPLGAPSQPR